MTEEELLAAAMLDAVAQEQARVDAEERGSRLLLLLLLLLGYTMLQLEDGTRIFQNARTGRTVNDASIRREIDRYLDTQATAAGALADKLRAGGISPLAFERAMRDIIRASHLNTTAIARGGYANLTLLDLAQAEGVIAREFKFLQKFVEELRTGGQKLDGTLARRAKLYARAARNTFYQARQDNLAGTMTHVRSILNPADHCDECIMLAGHWFRIGDPAYKLPGNRQCGPNCKCHEEYAAL